MSRRALIVLVVLATAGPARADDWMSGTDVRDVGDGYQLYFGADGLRVRKQGRSAPLRVGGATPTSTNGCGVVTTPDAVTLTASGECSERTVTFTHVQLEARLAEAAGARHLRAGRLEDAAAQLALAAADDPSFEGVALERAQALAGLGRVDEASVALAGLVDRAPVATYVRVATDPSLAPLHDHASLVRLRTRVPGDAQLDARTGTLPGGGVAIAPAGWLAFVELDGSRDCQFATSLVIRDGATLAPLASMALQSTSAYGDPSVTSCDGGFTPSDRRAAASNITTANRVLAELGFTPLLGVERATSDVSERGRRVRFPRAKLGLVIGRDGAARLFRHRKLVVEQPPGTLVNDSAAPIEALLLTTQHRILIPTFAFGCEFLELRGLAAFPVP